jgi:ADP-ribose pyrophosphatase YjhB (NUDIX family)
MTPQIQSGVLAYRRHKRRGLEVLLVKKPLSQNWGIPKGKLTAGLSLSENATKEAFEEAGVRGTIRPEIAGSYRTMKRRADRQVLVEVSVFLLEVTSIARKWPEKDTRLIRWCSVSEASRLLREPILIQLSQGLDRSATTPTDS